MSGKNRIKKLMVYMGSLCTK